MRTSGAVWKYSAAIIAIFTVIVLTAGTAVPNAVAETGAATHGYTRIFYYREGRLARESLFAYPSSIDVLAPQSYSLDGAGKLTGSVKPDVLAFVKKNKIKMMPLITNGNFNKSFKKLLDDTAKQDAAINALVVEAAKNGYWGWQIDFEQMDASWRDKFSAFVEKAAGVFKKNGLILSVAVIAQISGNPDDYPNDLWRKTIGVYDYASLAENSDFISLMSYDDPESTGPVARYLWLKRVLDYSLKYIPNEKISLGIPLYYWQWNNATGARVGIGGRQGIYNVFSKYKVSVNYNTNMEAAYLTYWNKAKQYTIWYENAKSVTKKIKLIKQYRLHGFSAWALGLELPSIFNVVKNNNY